MRNLRPYMSIFGIRYPVSSDLQKIIIGPRTVAGLLFESLSFRSMNLVLFNLFSLGDAIVFSNNDYVNFLFPDFAGNILKLPRTDWKCSFVTSQFLLGERMRFNFYLGSKEESSNFVCPLNDLSSVFLILASNQRPYMSIFEIRYTASSDSK